MNQLLYIVDVINYNVNMLEQLQGSERTIPEAVACELGVNFDFYVAEPEYDINIIYLNNEYSAVLISYYEGKPSKEAIIDGLNWRASAEVNINAFAFYEVYDL